MERILGYTMGLLIIASFGTVFLGILTIDRDKTQRIATNTAIAIVLLAVLNAFILFTINFFKS